MSNQDHPSAEYFEGKLKEAKEYFDDYSGSVGLYLELVEEGGNTEIPAVKQAWDAVLTNIPNDNSPPNHIEAARIAWKILNDTQCAMSLIKNMESLADQGLFDDGAFVLAMTVLAKFYSNFGSELDSDRIYAEDVYRVIEKAIQRASTENVYDLRDIIRCIGGTDEGTCYGDKDTAQRAIDTVVGKIADPKVKKKFKKKAQEYLDDVR